MSYKAQWNNRTVRKCSANNCVCSTTSGFGISGGLVRYGSFAMVPMRNADGSIRRYATGGAIMAHLRSAEYGREMTPEEADAIDRETGRSVPYGRNSVRFVMSRAARKRGIQTDDRSYQRRAKRGGACSIVTRTVEFDCLTNWRQIASV